MTRDTIVSLWVGAKQMWSHFWKLDFYGLYSAVKSTKYTWRSLNDANARDH